MYLVSSITRQLTLFYVEPEANWIRVQEPKLINSGLAIKRMFDLIISILAIIFLSPFLAIIACAVKLSSPGPVLYVQKRVGQYGGLITFPKFRSMYKDSDTQRAAVIGRPNEDIVERYRNDPRITQVGHFIRRWSLDELPQLFCVLFGTMSIVGPRPILPEESELVLGQHHYRFIAKPGLTGLWQISGRKEVDWNTRMLMDSDYIQNWTFAGDLLLIFKTFKSILTGKGAY